MSCWSDRETFTHAHGELTPTPGAFWNMLLSCIEEDSTDSQWITMRDNILARNHAQDMTTPTPTPLHCKVCAKPLRGQQRLYCSRPCKRRAYAAQRKLREAQELADVVEVGKLHSVPKPQPLQIEVIREGFDPVERDISVITAPTSKQSSLPRRLYAHIQLLGHTLYHVFDGWRTK